MPRGDRQVIAEFRANGGRVGGYFTGTPLLLLTTTGARTGRRRIVALTYLADGERYVVLAANAGASRNPDWYHNLVADPRGDRRGRHREVRGHRHGHHGRGP
jgi:deazaflavin-dependent oxidoreductase (nitroreductase family)